MADHLTGGHAAFVVLAVVIALLIAALPWWFPAILIPTDAELARISRPRSAPTDPLPPCDSALVIDLACAAIAGGASVPGTLIALGAALDAPADQQVASYLSAVGHALLLGASWEEAWQKNTEAQIARHRLTRALEHALAPAWRDGANPVPLLKGQARTIRAARARKAREAAAALGVRLTLPLGLCYLPAFILLGVVPIIIGITRQLLAGS